MFILLTTVSQLLTTVTL